VDWAQPAARVVRRIHGLWSWPAATCLFAARSGRRERVQLARAAVTDADASPSASAPAGSFLDDLSIQTGRGRVRLAEVKPAGGKLMAFADFANGRRVAPPDRFLPLDAE
jgi:methionyl-tRNA formyltransferase